MGQEDEKKTEKLVTSSYILGTKEIKKKKPWLRFKYIKSCGKTQSMKNLKTVNIRH